jgi:hypothetical protein
MPEFQSLAKAVGSPRRGGFEPTGETNLRRYKRSGTYFLNAKVHGQIYQESLNTTVLTTAIQRRDRRLAELRGTSNGETFAAVVRGKLVFVNLGAIKFRGEFVAENAEQVAALKALMRNYGTKPLGKHAIRDFTFTFQEPSANGA